MQWHVTYSLSGHYYNVVWDIGDCPDALETVIEALEQWVEKGEC